ncbi:CRTAC1 family protein [Allorhodopirellula solitaria]|uniref:FG-GAP repeat protein n=1 Tax=Allorhodopirellula solitaria TaxID=2527987 RepID=A0A5C5X1L7_9BACT|nr:CRTAC1 family protein [Allorhodopirellula solitaria]TWT56043.1 FG-GAP repeat protein [Allorhodopirellula solitaria]
MRPTREPVGNGWAVGRLSGSERAGISPAAARPRPGRCDCVAMLVAAMMGACLAAPGCGERSGVTGIDNPQERSAAEGDHPGGDKLFGADIQAEPAASRLPGDRVVSSTTGENRLHFVDVAQSSGMDFVYRNGEQGESLMVESTGGGVGVLDYDNDGRPDLFFNQGGDPQRPQAGDAPVALFRNSPAGRWVDVASLAGLADNGYGQGVATGDFNADGFDDVYLTFVGGNILLQNQGDGTFVDVTPATGTAGATTGSRWSSSAAFADLSGDGLLDLFVCNYTNYDPLHPVLCRNSKGENRICHPREMDALPNECFINQGDGTFVERASELGLVGPGSKSLGVAVADFDVDGDPDVYVANDTTANFLFLNDGHGSFQERALLRGCAVSGDGLFQASMGLAIGDYDRNGFPDIYSTHYYDESNTLYRNLGPKGFQDVTARTGLHVPVLHVLAFGTEMQDFDLDGYQDLFVTNGHVENYAKNPIHAMPPQLFAFDGTHWIERSESAGEFFGREYVGRGAVSLDFDDDGDLDLAVVHQNSPAALLRNDSQRGHFLKLRLIGRESPRGGTGARVVVTAGDLVLHQQRYGGGSFASTRQSVLVFGLAGHQGPCDVEVHWPSGKISTLSQVDVDEQVDVVEPSAS